MSTKRPPPKPSAPKPPVSLPSSLTIHDQASLTGTHPITIRSHSVISPGARLLSLHAPLTIGQTCVISEGATIGLLSASTASPPPAVILGDSVVVETHAVVEGQVGEGTLVEARAHVGPGAVVGRYCHIGVFCEVKAGEVVPDHTVVYGEGLRRVDGSGRDGARGRNVRSMVETLRVIVGSKPEKFM